MTNVMVYSNRSRGACSIVFPRDMALGDCILNVATIVQLYILPNKRPIPERQASG
jgi:hypothetical protein